MEKTIQEYVGQMEKQYQGLKKMAEFRVESNASMSGLSDKLNAMPDIGLVPGLKASATVLSSCMGQMMGSSYEAMVALFEANALQAKVMYEQAQVKPDGLAEAVAKAEGWVAELKGYCKN